MAPVSAADLLAAGLKLHQAGRLGDPGKLDDAIAAYRRAIDIKPDFAEAYSNLGVALKEQGKLNEAVAAYRQAIGIKPDYAEAHSNLGVSLKQQGKLSEAIAAFRQAIGIRPDYAKAYSNLGVALRQQGKLDEAVAAYRQAIGIKADFAEAYSNLGAALDEQGNIEGAVVAYRQAIGIKAGYAEFHSNLGVALYKQGRVTEALAAYRQAINLNPNYAEAYCNLGLAFKQLGKREEAVAAFRRAIDIKTNYDEAHFNLGIALKECGRLDEAVAAYRQAISIKPDYADAHCNLGVALKELGKLDEAVAAYRTAISIKPDYAEAHSNLGVALSERGKLDEAVAAYRTAISIKPDYAAAHANLGVALKEQGKLEEALKALESAIELAPANPLNYRLLGDVKRFCATDRHLAAMEKLARELPSLSPEEQIDLHFALAKAYEDLGEHERSFCQLLEGNALKRQRIVYDEQTSLAIFDRIRAVFTADLLRNNRSFGYPSSVPVFIIGMPRSGTTLVEQILASHPKVFGAGELLYLENAVRKLSRPGTAQFPEVIHQMGGEELRQFGASYVSAITTLASKAERVTDKMPMNFLFAGLISLVLPNARIIHTRRDPVDTCLSCFSKLFTGHQPYSYDLVELGRYYLAYEELMDHWRKALPPGVMLEVRYEDVIANLEGEARRIVGHCALEWDDACLSFYQSERPVRTASAAQVRQPIYRTSIGRWRSYEHLLQPLIEVLGAVPRGI